MAGRRTRTASLPSAVTLSLALVACSSAPNEIDKQLLTPPTAWLAEPADFGIAAEPVEIALHAEASITGFWLPHGNGEKRTVVLFHDGDLNASATHPYWRFLHDAGFSVLAFDPRGFGKSRGTSTFRTWLYDLPTLFAWLRARPDVDPQRIALFGTGTGSLAAYWAARTQHCQSLVVEHLPSLRAMLKAAHGNDDSAIGAMGLGFTEAAQLPEEIEPEDVAARCQVPTLFLATDGEPARDRQALLRVFGLHGGTKELWLLAGTGRAPHAMLTHDGEYQARIAGFLDATLAGKPHGLRTEVRKAADGRSGSAYWEFVVTAPTPVAARTAVEIGVVLTDGSTRFTNVWLEGASTRTRLELPSAPVHASAGIVPGAVEDPVATWVRPRNGRQLAAAAIDASWPRIERLRQGTLEATEERTLLGDLQAATAKAPFPADLEAELADVWARLGRDLANSPDAAERTKGQQLLQRSVAAMPGKPHLHVWPGPIATYGYPQETDVAMAKKLLAAPAK
ncbi:MAG: alpha/beta hydrolase [Planctomycetes bacterium]|nr:alpha/beta hydrolase [Planctomycetota bacterium]